MPNSAETIFKFIINSALPAIGDLCLFFISFYTFRLTILPKKLRFIGYRPCFSAFEGDSLEITLENRALSPVVVQSVSVVMDGYAIKIFSEKDEEYDGPCVIDGFKTGTIKVAPFSLIRGDEGELSFGIGKEIYLVVETPRGTQYLSYWRAHKRHFLKLRERRHPVKQAIIKRSYYNGKILKPYIRYAISYPNKNGELQTIFVFPSGLMSEAPFGYNGLTEEIAASQESMYAHFEKEFSKYNTPFEIREFPATGDLLSELFDEETAQENQLPTV